MSDVEQIDELIEELRKKTNEELVHISLELIKTLSEDQKHRIGEWLEEKIKIEQEELKSEEKED